MRNFGKLSPKEEELKKMNIKSHPHGSENSIEKEVERVLRARENGGN